MSVIDLVRQEWRASGLLTPTVLMGYYNGNWYATTSDHSSIVFFASNKGKIYAAVKEKVQSTRTQSGDYIYMINAGALQVISCKKGLTPADEFALNSIVRLFSQL